MGAMEEFSGFEVLRAAMEVEKNGHRFYSTMAVKAQSPLVQEIFTWLAQDEIGHLRALEALAERYQSEDCWQDEDAMLPYLRRFSEQAIFPSAERLAEVLGGPDPELRTLDLAIEAEERFAEFFQAAAAQARDQEGRRAFLWLAEEEERHARELLERRAKLAL